MLGFLYTKQVIDENKKVLDYRLADFYLGVFNRQLQRAGQQGSAYGIVDGYVEPNSKLLSLFDNEDIDYSEAVELSDSYTAKEGQMMIAQANTWSTELEQDIVDRYGTVTANYMKTLVEQGKIQTYCS